MVNFIVVNTFSPYMVILESTLHVKVKFPTEEGIVVIKGNQKADR